MVQYCNEQHPFPRRSPPNLPRDQGAVGVQVYLFRVYGVGQARLYVPWVYVATKMNRVYDRHTRMIEESSQNFYEKTRFLREDET